MLLGFAVERLSGEPLDQFCSGQIYEPLGARPLAYARRGPLSALFIHHDAECIIVPTEEDPWRKRMLCGEVHDENAYALGESRWSRGVVRDCPGRTGCFSSLDGWLAQKRGLLEPEIVRTFTTNRQGFPNSSWALGWDTPSVRSSSGTRFLPSRSAISDSRARHCGSIRSKELEVVLLSNRVHPTRRNEQIRSSARTSTMSFAGNY